MIWVAGRREEPGRLRVAAHNLSEPMAVRPRVFRFTNSDDSPLRTQMAVLLAQFGQDSRPAIPQLIKLLDHPNDMTRQRAAYALSTIGGKDILPAQPGLVRMLGAKRSFVREMAAKTLGETGPTANLAIDPIIKLLSDEDDHVRAAAATSLGKIGPKTTKVHLALAKAMSDESGRVRSSVAPALAPHAPINEPMLQVFIKASEDNWRGVTDGCEAFFRRLGPEHKKRIPARFDPDNPTPRG